MPSQNSVVYLSRGDVETLDLSMQEILDAVELALIEKAHKRTQMPPKHWMEPTPIRWFGAMTSIVPKIQSAACKWQSGSSENATHGLPYITGLLILNDLPSGLPVAIMDSTWITAQRTGAESAIAAKYLANPDVRNVAMIGCGVQARTNIEALRLVRTGISEIYAFDINPKAVSAYAREMDERWGYRVRACNSPREAVEAGDIVITAGPIEPDANRTIDAGWLKPGALGITLDYDCYWRTGAFAAANSLYTDDFGQIEHLKEYGYFVNTPRPNAELGDVVAGFVPGRSSPNDVIVTINMGVAVEDVVTARRIFELSQRQGMGTSLPL
jgi:ornithine cyclodeaminase/alanine dehydrogenase-like protein (mu-crystallin family)